MDCQYTPVSIKNGITIGLFLLLPFFFSCKQVTAQKNITEHTISSDKYFLLDDYSKLDWLSGKWTIQEGAESTQEYWSESRGLVKMGMFQMHGDIAMIFSEIIQIANDEESTLMRIKHFSHDLKAWEDREEMNTFRLIQLENQKATFEGLTYERINDQLFVYLADLQKDGSYKEIQFEFSLDASH